MNKKKIFEMADYINSAIIHFSEFYKNENISETSYSNWNARDVIAHINCWIENSGNKLENIKQKNYRIEEINFEFIEKNNKLFYEKYKGTLLENVKNDTKTVLENYVKVIDLYTEEDLLSTEFPIGISLKLSEYMAYDIFLHPLQHLLCYYKEHESIEEFFKLLEESQKYSTIQLQKILFLLLV